MSAASGLKHVATEPSQLDNKRERRRGNSTRAAGRAAALRRVPSDSDCSVETASLSADSGDRSVRPPPPPVRTSKSRSRRRGSEWEVLEGLKDGQRFDKRPEVFNGYLHKKRKWPLKGWHKRFFVVDGGILVYARSAGDVARGRLHGSVDVGLSVLSAKPRRRRIDIDADEFIYHLRAKTHDAFRTWLHVLKTHRLYRQHLLTFGARESVPKIHAPLDDIPPNENSSRMITSSKHFDELPIQSSIYKSAERNFLSAKRKTKSEKKPYTCSKHYYKRKPYFVSLCSWSTRNEKSKLDFSNQLACIKSSIRKHSFNFPLDKDKKERNNRDKEKIEHKNAKKRSQDHGETDFDNSQINFALSQFVNNIKCDSEKIRRIQKSTNVIKYKNKFKEPILKNAYNFVALNNSKRLTFGSNSYSSSYKHRKLQKQKNDRLHGVSQYDNMVVKKIVQLLFDEVNEEKEIFSTRAYLNKVFEELYVSKLHSKNKNVTKNLFKYLLEYWLKNASTFYNADVERKHKIVNRKVNKCTSNIHYVSSCSVATQVYDNKNVIKSDTFRKVKRDSDLEEVLNNIVYKCESMNTIFDEQYISTNNLLREQKSALTKEIFDPMRISKFKKTLSRLLSKIPISTETALAILQLYLDILDDESDNEMINDNERVKTNHALKNNIESKLINHNVVRRGSVDKIYSANENTTKMINLTKVLNNEYENNNNLIGLASKDPGNILKSHDTVLNDTAKDNLFESINVLDSKKTAPFNDIGINILVYTNFLNTVFKNPMKPVDENIILLLLDHLLPLSKSTAIHKDINNLCMKLKKKFGRNTEEHGLSLLGKIYADVRSSTIDQQTSTDTDLMKERNENLVELKYADKSTQ